MWARVVEFMLACWLAVSPFVFRHGSEQTWLWVNDLSTAFVIGMLSLMSFAQRTKHAHYITLIIATWLIAFGFFAAEPPPPVAYQNHVIVGLLLLMFAILPNDADHPPREWHEFYKARERSSRENDQGM